MILVTGATGNTGGALVAALREKNVPFAAMVRRPEAAEQFKRDGIEARVADLDQRQTLVRALEGVDAAFLVSPASPELPRLQRRFITAAKEAGVRRIVKLSGMGAHPHHPCGFLRWNAIAETILMASGVGWTMLRPTGFLQNVGALCAGMVKQMSGIYLPAGDARISMIDVRDIAAAAAVVLTEEGHENRIYDLTGPELVSHYDIADQLTELLGRPVSYHPVTDVNAWKAMGEGRLPDALRHAVIALWQGYRRGDSAVVSGWVEILTGRPPIGLRDYLEDNLDLFRA